MQTKAELWFQTQYQVTDRQARDAVEGVNERLVAEIVELRAIVATLPTCWRLNEAGEPVQDVPVVPGMRVWPVAEPSEPDLVRIVGGDYLQLSMTGEVYRGADVATTREAAKAVGGGG